MCWKPCRPSAVQCLRGSVDSRSAWNRALRVPGPVPVPVWCLVPNLVRLVYKIPTCYFSLGLRKCNNDSEVWRLITYCLEIVSSSTLVSIVDDNLLLMIHIYGVRCLFLDSCPWTTFSISIRQRDLFQCTLHRRLHNQELALPVSACLCYNIHSSLRVHWKFTHFIDLLYLLSMVPILLKIFLPVLWICNGHVILIHMCLIFYPPTFYHILKKFMLQSVEYDTTVCRWILEYMNVYRYNKFIRIPSTTLD